MEEHRVYNKIDLLEIKYMTRMIITVPGIGIGITVSIPPVSSKLTDYLGGYEAFFIRIVLISWEPGVGPPAEILDTNKSRRTGSINILYERRRSKWR